jgi:hypothetical protein
MSLWRCDRLNALLVGPLLPRDTRVVTTLGFYL